MRTISNFPLVENLTEIPADIIVATQNSQVSFEPGLLRLFPANGGGYCGLRDFWFETPQKVICVGEEIEFTSKLLDNIDRSLKHIIVNRLTERVRDGSNDRGITYIWHDGSQNFSVGACHVTECTYEGGGFRPYLPIPEDKFSLRRFAGQKIYLVSEFNLNDHKVRVFVSTKDGEYRNFLLAEKSLNVVEPENDYWSRIDMIGAYVDRGVIPDPNAMMGLTGLVVHNDLIQAPENFFNDYVPPVVVQPPVITQHRELDNALRKALSNLGIEVDLSGGQFEVEGGEIRMTPIRVTRT